MKINSSGLDRYKSYLQSVGNGEGGSAKTKEKNKVTANNTDKITISGEAAAKAELGRLASTVAAEVEGAVSAERLGELRAAVQDGSYYVSSEDLADAMLSRVIPQE